MSKRLRDRLDVAPPRADVAQDRVERRLWSTAVGLDSSRPAIAPTRRRWLSLAMAVAGAAAAIAVFLLQGRWSAQDAPMARVSDPSTIVTGPGQGSRVMLDQVVVDVGADTRAAIHRQPEGGALLDLAAGSLDCDVAPLRRTTPFRVRAGAVTVTVMGTRFVVWRSGDRVRVDVLRGRVRVDGPEVLTEIGAGETWSSIPPAMAPAGPSEEPDSRDGAAPTQGEPAAQANTASPSRRNGAPPIMNPTFARAQQVEASSPDEAAALYRDLGKGRGAWAALALYSLADLESRRGRRAAALALVNQYERRFPHGANTEDIAWLRVETLRRDGAYEEARAAAAAYLARHAAGAYARPARRMLDGETGR